ncbi:MAG: GNAT family N-acetyltransferase [Brevirhabdus sp.]
MNALNSVLSQAQIESERFDLRALRASDAGPMSLYAGDDRVANMTTSIPHPYPPGAAEAYIASVTGENPRQHVWVIDGTRAGQAELLGLISLMPLGSKQAEIGYWIAPPMWNTGIASEAVATLLEANPLGNSAYFAQVFQDNPGSARVLTNHGFEYIGDAEAFSVSRGANVPTWTYCRKLK